jgi:hypothetical protein
LNESSINRKNVSILIKSLIPLNDPLDLIIAARGIFFTVMWIAISNGGEQIEQRILYTNAGKQLFYAATDV